jgi:CubicO group peptidase (beta-lactamase class C family)
MKAGLALANVIALALGIAAATPGAANEYPVGTRSSMWDPAHYIGSFRHMDEIFPTRVVRRAGPVFELPRGEAIATLTYSFGGTTRDIEDYFRRTRTTGFLVVKDGQIVFERYMQGADETARFTSWSVAKSFVSTLVGLAIDDGLIRSVDDPISDYIPELKGSGYEAVPIKAVLQMSSGVDFEEDYGNASSDFERLWNQSVHFNRTPVTQFAAKSKSARPAFEKFDYVSIDTVALGWLVSRVTGKSLSDYLSEKLWGPLGMEADATWITDDFDHNPAANEAAFCCLNARLRDYARFGLLMLQGGAWQGRQLLPEGWVAAATRPDRPQVQPGRLYDGYPLGYQYQWWTFPGADRAFTAQGINGQFLYINPAHQTVIVVTSAWPSFWDDGLESELYAIFDAFTAPLDG